LFKQLLSLLMCLAVAATVAAVGTALADTADTNYFCLLLLVRAVAVESCSMPTFIPFHIAANLSSSLPANGNYMFGEIRSGMFYVKVLYE
jgi:hypothetical protein